MSRYLIRRTVQAVPLLLGISVLVFLLLQMTPGGPLAVSERSGASGRVTQEDFQRLRDKYGLDDPLYVQYFNWLKELVQGDWGTSFNTGRPVLTMIGERLPTTLTLTGAAFLITLCISIPVGILAATRQYTIFDYFSTSVAFLGISIPSFWLGLMLIYLFTFQLGWLPSVGLTDPRQDHEGWAGIWDRITHLIMPVTILALASTASMTRYLRAAMLDVISQDYVRTARAKGLTERVVIGYHALKNGAVPLVTVLALELPDLFIGAVITESIFAISGMGRLFVESANLRDYPVLMGILLIASVLVIVSNLLADVVYGLIDPRISFR
ncbi:MAG: ABC transporter permease [Thermomicrobiales bacterium]